MNRWLPVWITALGCLASPGLAAADTLQLRLVQDVIHVAPGMTLDVSATITNPTSNVVFLTGITSALPPSLAQDDVFDLFQSFKPEFLGPGESWQGPVLHLTVSASAVPSIQAYDLALTGGTNDYDAQPIALTYFTVDDSSEVTGVDASRTLPRRLRVSPNPFRVAQSIEFDTGFTEHVEVEVFDATGRSTALLYSGTLRAGSHQFHWDGKDDSGVPQTSGVYFVRVRGPHGTLTSKVLRIR